MNNEFIAMPGSPTFEVENLANSGNTHPAEWFFDWATGGHRSDSGVSVTGYTALTHCPLWQGVNIIAGDIGQVPVRLVRNEFYDQRQHNAWQLLRVRPNTLQTVSVFLETIMQWALIWGNGVAWTPRRGSQITDLIPLRPDCLWPELVSFDDGQVLIYHYWSPTSGKEFVFFPEEVIHIQGITGDGIWGYPLSDIAKNCIGQGLALEKHGNRTFSNGARPAGVLEHPNQLNAEARENMRRDWERIHGGPDNAGKVAILWEGMKFNAVSMSNLDAQWIEAKKMSRIDAASLLNLPAHKLNALEDSSVRSNLEEQNETYKQMTLTRWGNRLDEEFRRKLLTDREWKSDEYRFHFDWDAFLRADIETLTQIGERAVMAEIMNRNEARKLLGLAPYEGGERFGSPAINPQQDENDTPESEDEPSETTEETPENGSLEPENRVLAPVNGHARHAMQELLAHHIEVVLQREHDTVSRAAKGAKNFVKHLDKFYIDGGFGEMAESIISTSVRASCASGLDARCVPIALENYAKSRHSQLLELCSHVTKDELPKAIAELSGVDRSVVAHGLLASALGITEERNDGT